MKIHHAKNANFEEMFTYYSADMMGSSQACKSVLASWLSYAQERAAGLLLMMRATLLVIIVKHHNFLKKATLLLHSLQTAQSLLKDF